MSASGPSIDGLALVALVLATGLAAFLVFHFSPRFAIATWLVGVGFVPVWFGVSVGPFLSLTTVLGVLVLVSLTPLDLRPVTTTDWIVVAFFAACLAPIAVGAGNINTFALVLTQWCVAYGVGRLAPIKTGLTWIYGAVAVVFTAVAIGTLTEFFLSWNPFVTLSRPNSLYVIWGTLQERGGIIRAEWAFGHSIALGASLALAVPLVLASSFSVRVRLVMSATLLAASAVTFSRIGIIGAILGFILSVVFLGHALTTRAKLAMVAGLLVVGAVLAPVVVGTFSMAGNEAINSSAYRGNLLRLLPEVAVFGTSGAASTSSVGERRFGNFESIDSALIYLGLNYGWIAFALAILLLAGAVVTLFAGRATPPTIALVAGIPALTSVALITQYSLFFWFVAGLAVYAQAIRTGAPSGLARGGELGPMGEPHKHQTERGPMTKREAF